MSLCLCEISLSLPLFHPLFKSLSWYKLVFIFEVRDFNKGIQEKHQVERNEENLEKDRIAIAAVELKCLS